MIAVRAPGMSRRIVNHMVGSRVNWESEGFAKLELLERDLSGAFGLISFVDGDKVYKIACADCRGCDAIIDRETNLSSRNVLSWKKH